MQRGFRDPQGHPQARHGWVPRSSAAPRPRSLLPYGTLGSGPTVQGETFLNAGVHPCVQVWSSYRAWEAGAPALRPACLCSDARAPENGHPAQDNRHEQISGQQGCEAAPHHRHRRRHGPWGAAHGRGRGRPRELELLGPCSPEKEQTRGIFWFPKHLDCFVLSLKYCSLTDMALTIGNGQRRHMSLSEIKA